MVLYFFVKDANGQCQLRGGVDCSVPPELVEVQTLCSEAGLVPADAAEYEAQVINGAKAGMIPDPSLGTSAPAEPAPETPAAPAAA